MNLPDLPWGSLAHISSMPAWAVLLSKATLLLAIVWVLHITLARVNPRWRVLLWRGAVVGLGLLVFWTLGLPDLEVSLLAPEATSTMPSPSLPTVVAERAPAGLPQGELLPTEVPASVEIVPSAHQSSTDSGRNAALAVGAEPFEELMSWRAALLGIWSLGTTLLLTRLTIAYLRLARVMPQTSQNAPEWVLAEVQRIAAEIACRRAIRVRSSQQFAVPFLCGLRRPILVLPERMCRPDYRSQLPGIVAHELTHLRSRDFGWNVALQMVSILLWFHPLAWRIVMVHRRACDAVCDAVSASYLGDVQVYCRTLARVALEAASSLPAAGLAMAGSCDVRRRVAALQRMVFAMPLRRRSVIGCGLAALLAVTALGSLQFALAESQPEEPVAAASEAEAGADEEPTTARETEHFPWHPEELEAVFGDERGRQWGWIGTVAVSPDGKQVASGGADGMIWLWNAATMQLQSALEGHTDFVISVGYSADGKTLVSGSWDGTLRSWDLSAGKLCPQSTFTTPSKRLTAVARSVDGQTVAARISEEEIAFARLNERELIPTHTVIVPMVSSQSDHTPEEKDLANQLLISGRGNPLAISPQGNTLAVASGGGRLMMNTRDGPPLFQGFRDSEVRLYDLNGAKPILRETVIRAPDVGSLAFSPDGKTLAVGSANGEVRLWSVNAAEPKEEVTIEHGTDIEQMAFSPKGDMLATGGGMIRVWDLSGPNPREHRTCRTSTWGGRALAFSPDGAWLLAAHATALRRWRVAGTDNTSDPKRYGHRDRASSLGLTPDGKTLITSGALDGTIRIWQFEDPSAKPLGVLNDFQGQTDKIVVSPDGKRFVFSNYKHPDYRLRIWRLSEGKLREWAALDLHSGHPGSFWCSAFTPDGEILATGHRDGRIRYWDLTGSEPKQYAMVDAHRNGVCSLHFSADGKKLASGGYDKRVSVWQLVDGEPRGCDLLGAHDAIARQVRLSGDGRLLASGDNAGTIKLWDLTAPKPPGRELKFHSKLISSLRFSSDAKTLLSTSQDGRVVLWNTASGERSKTWEFPGAVHDGAFSPGDRHIVTANANGSAYVLRHPTAAATE